MKRVEVLREQASVLRTLAASFDVPDIKEQLLSLAERCDQLALNMARHISERLQQPISGSGSGSGPVSGSTSGKPPSD